jgi:hypothetical protein
MKEYRGCKIFRDAFKQVRFYDMAQKEQEPGMDYEFADSFKDAKKRIDRIIGGC